MRRTAAVLAAVLGLAAPAAAAAAPTTIRLSAEPRAGVMAGGHLWAIADRAGARVLLEVDVAKGRPTGREVVIATGVPRDPAGLSYAPRPSVTLAGGAIWTTDPVTGAVVRVDPARATVSGRHDLSVMYLAVGPAGLWGIAAPVPAPQPPFVLRRFVRIDPATGTVVQQATIGPQVEQTHELAVGTGRVWASKPGWFRIDATTGSAIRAGSVSPFIMFARAGTLYWAQRGTCNVGVETSAGASRSIGFRPCSMAPRDLAAGPGGSVWLATFRNGGRPGILLQRPADGSAGRRTFLVGRDPVDVVPGRGAVWVLNRADRSITRVPAVRFK